MSWRSKFRVAGFRPSNWKRSIIHLLRPYLHESDQTPAVEPTWTDAEALARRVIANNRDLFEELAQL